MARGDGVGSRGYFGRPLDSRELTQWYEGINDARRLAEARSPHSTLVVRTWFREFIVRSRRSRP